MSLCEIMETSEVQALTFECRLLLAWVESVEGVLIWPFSEEVASAPRTIEFAVEFLQRTLRTDPLRFNMHEALTTLLDRDLLCIHDRLTVSRSSRMKAMYAERIRYE